MSAFADSSALVKLYSDEEGNETVRSVETLVVSCVDRVEVPAAVWKKQRMAEIDPGIARALIADFETDYYGDEATSPRFAVLSLPGRVLDEAARLVAVHGLGAYDGIQLASARAARGADPGCDRFACFDEELRAAAAQEGFALVP